MPTVDPTPSPPPKPVLDYERASPGDPQQRRTVIWLSIAAIVYGAMQATQANTLSSHALWMSWRSAFEEIRSGDWTNAGYVGLRLTVGIADLLLIAGAIGCLFRRDLRAIARYAALTVFVGTLACIACQVLTRWFMGVQSGLLLTELTYYYSDALAGLALPLLILVLFRRRTPDELGAAFTRCRAV